jgi:hypothetical protein
VGPAPSDIALVTYLQRLKEQGWNVDRTERKMMMCGVKGIRDLAGDGGIIGARSGLAGACAWVWRGGVVACGVVWCGVRVFVGGRACLCDRSLCTTEHALARQQHLQLLQHGSSALLFGPPPDTHTHFPDTTRPV